MKDKNASMKKKRKKAIAIIFWETYNAVNFKRLAGNLNHQTYSH